MNSQDIANSRMPKTAPAWSKQWVDQQFTRNEGKKQENEKGAMKLKKGGEGASEA